MKILVTGATGFLGKKIISELKNHDVRSLSRKNSWYNFDIASQVPEFQDDFELVIHAAGKAHVIPNDEVEKKQFFEVNVLGTKNLLVGLSKSKIPSKFIFISSVSVYGLQAGEDIDETSPLLATNPYGKSKIEAEMLILKWCFENGIKLTILRLPLIVGSNSQGNLAAMIKGIKLGYYFNISGGTARKSMVLVSDVTRILLKVAEIGGIYNLTDGIHPSFCELSKSISFKFGKSFVPNMPLSIALLFAKIGDVLGKSAPINTEKLTKLTSTLTFDDSKAKNAFEWNPTPILEGGEL